MSLSVNRVVQNIPSGLSPDHVRRLCTYRFSAFAIQVLRPFLGGTLDISYFNGSGTHPMCFLSWHARRARQWTLPIGKRVYRVNDCHGQSSRWLQLDATEKKKNCKILSFSVTHDAWML